MVKTASNAVVVLVAALALVLSGCGDFFVSNSSTDHVTLSTTALILSTTNSAGTGPETKQISATAVTVGGTSTDVSSSATWTSSDASVATVDATGKVTAVKTGTATISAKSGGVSGTATVLVETSTVSSVAASPSSVTLHTLSGPTTAQLKAIATLASGTTVDVTQYATWSSDTTSVATVSSTGLVSAVTGGAIGGILGQPNTAKITTSVMGGSGTQSGTSTISVDAL